MIDEDPSNDALQGDVPRGEVPQVTRKDAADDKERQAKLRRLDQSHRQRRVLFWTVMVGLALSYLSTGFMMWTYLAHVDYRPDPVIMTAWISASVVQLVGLLYVITKNLFPPDGG